MKPSKRDIYELLERVEKKVDAILKRSDFSVEDATVKAASGQIASAISKLPQQEGKQ